MECWRREPNLDFIRAHYKCEGKKCVVVMFSYYYGGGRSQQLPTPSCSEGCCVNDQDSDPSPHLLLLLQLVRTNSAVFAVTTKLVSGVLLRVGSSAVQCRAGQLTGWRMLKQV